MENKEREYVRRLAKRVKEISCLPEQEEKKNTLKLVNGLKKTRVPVLLSLGNSWSEIVPDNELVIQDPLFKSIEMDLRQRIYHADKLRDDWVIEDLIFSNIVTTNTGWGIHTDFIKPEQLTGAGHYEPVIKEEKDAEKIKMPEVSVDFLCLACTD